MAYGIAQLQFRLEQNWSAILRCWATEGENRQAVRRLMAFGRFHLRRDDADGIQISPMAQSDKCSITAGRSIRSYCAAEGAAGAAAAGIAVAGWVDPVTTGAAFVSDATSGAGFLTTFGLGLGLAFGTAAGFAGSLLPKKLNREAIGGLSLTPPV